MLIIDEKMGNLRDLHTPNLEKKGQPTKMGRDDSDRVVPIHEPGLRPTKKIRIFRNGPCQPAEMTENAAQSAPAPVDPAFLMRIAADGR